MKRCSVEGCHSPVWSKGVCRSHTPKTPIKKSCSISKKKTGLEKVVDDALNDIFKRDRFFMDIWLDRDHKCEVCGVPLGHYPSSYMFDHLLEKSKYPLLEFENDNIALVCLECHDKKTRGFINEKYQELINFVITKYNIIS